MGNKGFDEESSTGREKDDSYEVADNIFDVGFPNKYRCATGPVWFSYDIKR